MNNRKAFLISMIILLSNCISLAQPIKIDPYNYKIKKHIVCKNGAVVSAHTLASEVGVQILKQGGNAMDAAIATQLALAVVYPNAGNIGGGGFMVAHLKNPRRSKSFSQGENISIDYREVAPAAAYRDMYLDSNGNPQMNLSQNGHLAVGVPGTVAGIFSCIKYSKLPFKKLIQPAINLAENGFTITQREADSLNNTKKKFLAVNFSATAFTKESLWKAGDTLIQKDLAKTLIRIRDNGAKGFYEGETARLIVEEMKKGNGIITEKDLKNYKTRTKAPISFNYKDYQIISMPLPGSGIILQQMMKMIEKRNIAAMGFQTVKSVHLMTEVERRAYADRAKFLGDPDFVKVPVKTLVSEKYLNKRMHDYDPLKANNSTDVKAGNINAESEETTHISIIDKDGNAVSITTTLNGGYGSKVVVTGAGFLLNNEMDDFSVKPGVPNMFGAVGAEANAVFPGKRMVSSMTPTIVLNNNKPYLIVGTPGGTTITTGVFQTLVNILEFNLTAEDAVNKPKFHHQWLPDRIDVEKGFPEKVRTDLIKMGYKINDRVFTWRTELIQVLPDKKIKGVADNRGDDSAVGYKP
ncbi:MAG: gamma-glutamyltransferase [Chitinophagaceae bacterium]